MKVFEVNFDGLVGPTHNYAGLSFGNKASIRNAKRVSNPKLAALQGLEKMRLLMNLKIPQAVLPPHERPNLSLLYNVGYSGDPAQILETVYKENPSLFRAIYSASSMWTANAATVSSSLDSVDKKCHITPANLISLLHRSQEAETNYRVFKKIFSNEKYFLVHNPLVSHPFFADEGAANHNRFCMNHGEPGLQIFVYGRSADKRDKPFPKKFPARQTLEASKAIARLHNIPEDKILFVKQNPYAIDKGVFHNDVISVVNENVFLFHELAFENTEEVIKIIKQKASNPIYFLPIKESELSIEEAVKTYLFNSQIVTVSPGSMIMLAPEECQDNKATQKIISKIVEIDNPISKVRFVDCRQSMLNGGGPACLRLRVVLTEEELKACSGNVILNDTLYEQLVQWVNRYYRDRLTENDLRDPSLLNESRVALDELTKLLDLGSIYSFQSNLKD